MQPDHQVNIQQGHKNQGRTHWLQVKQDCSTAMGGLTATKDSNYKPAEWHGMKCEQIMPQKDLSNSRTKPDGYDIQNIMSTLSCMVNPFASTVEAFVHLATGAIASPSFTTCLMSAQKHGMEAFITYAVDTRREKGKGKGREI